MELRLLPAAEMLRHAAIGIQHHAAIIGAQHRHVVIGARHRNHRAIIVRRRHQDTMVVRPPGHVHGLLTAIPNIARSTLEPAITRPTVATSVSAGK